MIQVLHELPAVSHPSARAALLASEDAKPVCFAHTRYEVKIWVFRTAGILL